MRLGIFAKTFPGTDPAQVLAAAKAAGFASVQYNMACSGLPAMPDAILPAVTTGVHAAAQRQGIAIAAVSGTYNMIHPDPAIRAAGLRRLAVLIDAAAAMGTGMVTLCTGTRDAVDQWRHHPDNGTPAAWRDLLDEMGKAAMLAEARGIRLGIEPELANVVDTAASARRLIDDLQSPSLAIVLDPANLFEVAGAAARRDLVVRAVDLLADRIVMAHAKDRSASGAFVAAGQGVIDFAHFIACLQSAGFNGDLVAHGLDASESAAVAAFLAPLAAR